MNKVLTLSSIAALLMSPLALAETSDESEQPDRVEIEWQNPKKFSDVRAASGSNKKYRENTFKQLEKYLEKLATKLPEGQQLKITVTDLDLAGKVWPGHFVGVDTTSDVRMIKRIDFPSMDFSYQLLNAEGQVLQEGTEEIKDMSFQDRANRHFKNDSLRYEKNMLNDWFRKTLLKPQAEEE